MRSLWSRLVCHDLRNCSDYTRFQGSLSLFPSLLKENGADSYQLNQQGVSAMWSIREDFVAVFVGQAPIVYSMTKPTFWKSVYGYGTHSSSPNDTGRKNESYHMKGTSNKKPKDPYSVTQIGLTVSESQEEIIKIDDSSSDPKGNEANGIMVKRTYDVETRSQHGGDQSSGRTFYRDDST